MARAPFDRAAGQNPLQVADISAMRDENDKPLPDEVANDQDSVVVAPAGLSDRPPPTALQLRGEAAAPILDLVAGAPASR